MISLVEGRAPSQVHNQGAAALLRHRGRRNFRTDFARKLYVGVTSQVAINALQNGTTVEPTPPAWGPEMSKLPQNAASRLSHLSQEAANVLAIGKATLSLPEPSVTLIGEIVADAQRVDSRLLLWQASLPLHWHPVPANDLSLAALIQFQAYGTVMDIYSDLWVVSVYNSFRELRMSVNLLLLACIARMGTHFRPPGPFGPLAHRIVVQRQADEICASLPFALGDRITNEATEEVSFPWIPGSTPSSQHRNAAMGVGSWSLMGPLGACMKIPFLPQSQREWIQVQLRRMESFYRPTYEIASLVCR